MADHADHIVEFVCPTCQTHRFDKAHAADDQFSACPVCNGEPLSASGAAAPADSPDSAMAAENEG